MNNDALESASDASSDERLQEIAAILAAGARRQWVGNRLTIATELTELEKDVQIRSLAP